MAGIAVKGVEGFQPIANRQSILDDAKQAFFAGETIEQVANRHSIHPRTLERWLAALGDEYADLRKEWIDQKLADADRGLDEAAEGLDACRLAGAREVWKKATWYAERRDARYKAGPTVAVQTNVQVVISKDDLDL